MPLPEDPAITARIRAAGREIGDRILAALTDERGVHLETALAAAGALAGAALLRATGVDVSQFPAGAPVFVDAVNETGPAVVGYLLECVTRLAAALPEADPALAAPPAGAVPPDHQPLRPRDELLRLLWPSFEEILARHGVPADRAAFAAAAAAARFVVEGRAALAPAVAKTVAVEAMVAASKSVPPVPFGPPGAGGAPRPSSGGGAPPRRPRAPFGRDRLVGILALIVVSVTALLIGVKSMFMIRSPTGSPWGPALRTDTDVVQLISRLEPYVPTLHRDPAKDRYEVNVYLQPLDGGPGRLVNLRRHLPIARMPGEWCLLGSDGTYLWYFVDGIGALDLASGRQIDAEDLRRANPGLANLPDFDNSNDPLIAPEARRPIATNQDLWSELRRYDFGTRLRVTAPDYQHAFEVDPATLKATPLPAGSTRPSHALGNDRPESWLLPSGPDAPPISDCVKPAFLRGGPGAPPLRLADPPGLVVACAASSDIHAALKVTRFDVAGRVAWSVDTGIERESLRQILADETTLAFIGPRPAVPDKVSEPLLVLIRVRDGGVTTRSLWQ